MKRSMNLFFGLALLALGWCAACKPQRIDTDPDVVIVGLGQSVRLASGVSVRVDSLLDSTCPVGYNCIWAGMATAKIAVSKNNDQLLTWLRVGHRTEAGPGSRYSDSTGARLGGQTYKIILRALLPARARDSLAQPTSAMVQVTRV
jgi:hypothetical protein